MDIHIKFAQLASVNRSMFELCLRVVCLGIFLVYHKYILAWYGPAHECLLNKISNRKIFSYLFIVCCTLQAEGYKQRPLSIVQ